mgnify:FL=1
MKITFNNIGLKYRCLIKKVFSYALKSLGQPKNVELNMAFVSPRQIKYVNATQRGTDSVTDVLSFPMLDVKAPQIIDETYAADKNPLTGNYILGDVIVCKNVAEQQADEYDHSLKREVAFLCLHGLLHLLGYDHENPKDEAIMMGAADDILHKFKITR